LKPYAVFSEPPSQKDWKKTKAGRSRFFPSA